QHLSGHRHDPVFGGQLPELRAGRGRGIGRDWHGPHHPRPRPRRTRRDFPLPPTGHGRYCPGMQKGAQAPNFTLPDQTGTTRTLDELLSKGPLVLFFYPAANTPVCTAEACHFRDLNAEFAALGASCAGISTDAVDTQAGFASSQRLDYPLLSDADGAVAARF